MKKRIVYLIMCVIIIGCSPSTDAIQKAIAQTQRALPTSTLTHTITPEPTYTNTPKSTNTPEFTNTPEVTNTPEFTYAPQVTITFKPTRTFQPSHTPRPTLTPNTRSDFEKCEQSGVGVRYVVSGKGVDGISVTEQNDSNGINQGDFGVPYCNVFMSFNSGDFVYISAQIIHPTFGAGSITCKIYQGDSIIAVGSASGFPNIATCSGSLK